MIPWLVISFAVALIGVAKSGFGGGLGLIVVPITTLALPFTGLYRGEDALGLLLPLLIVGDITAVSQYWRHVKWPVLRRLIPGAIVGILLGTALIWVLKSHASIAASLINMEIGFESILLVAMSWYRQSRGRQQRLVREPLRAIGAGTFAGTSTTLAHAAGPIIAMYLLPLDLGRMGMVATSAMFFFLANCTKLFPYWQAGLFAKINPAFSLLFCPLVLGGAVFGKWLCKKMSDRLFIQIVYLTVFFLGGFLFFKGLHDLIG